MICKSRAQYGIRPGRVCSAMAREYARLGQPAPARLGAPQEGLVDEIEHDALPRRVGDLAVDVGREQERILAVGRQREPALQPASNAPVVECAKRQAHARLGIVELQPQRAGRGQGRGLPERHQPQHGHGRGLRQRPRPGGRCGHPGMPGQLGDQRDREARTQDGRHDPQPTRGGEPPGEAATHHHSRR